MGKKVFSWLGWVAFLWTLVLYLDVNECSHHPGCNGMYRVNTETKNVEVYIPIYDEWFIVVQKDSTDEKAK